MTDPFAQAWVGETEATRIDLRPAAWRRTNAQSATAFRTENSRVSSIIVKLLRPGSRAARLNEKCTLMLR